MIGQPGEQQIVGLDHENETTINKADIAVSPIRTIKYLNRFAPRQKVRNMWQQQKTLFVSNEYVPK